MSKSIEAKKSSIKNFRAATKALAGFMNFFDGEILDSFIEDLYEDNISDRYKIKLLGAFRDASIPLLENKFYTQSVFAAYMECELLYILSKRLSRNKDNYTLMINSASMRVLNIAGRICKTGTITNDLFRKLSVAIVDLSTVTLGTETGDALGAAWKNCAHSLLTNAKAKSKESLDETIMWLIQDVEFVTDLNEECQIGNSVYREAMKILRKFDKNNFKLRPH